MDSSSSRPEEVELFPGTGASAPTGRTGFTLIELAIVLVVVAVMLAIGGLAFTDYFDRTSARRAALVFARDVSFARSSALRSRERVVIRFHESNLFYQIDLQESGTRLVARNLGPKGDVTLTSVDLRTDGDTVVVDDRGVMDLSGILGTGSLGEARFASGSKEYSVYFNSMGASKVEER